MRWMALVATIALLIGGVMWLTTPRTSPAIALVEVQTTHPTAKETVLSEPASATDTRVADPRTASRPYKPDGPTIRIHGTIVVLDEAGVEHAPRSGSFQVWLSTNGRPWLADAHVSDGGWSAEVAQADEISLWPAMLDGRVAYAVEPASKRPFPQDHQLHVRFQWPPDIVLHARDAATGADLKDIEVRGYPWPTQYEIPAGRDVNIRGSSPLTIRLGDPGHLIMANSLFVRDATHAWTEVTADPHRGGDVFAELQPASGLSVVVTGDRSINDVNIRVFSKKDRGYGFEVDLGTKASIEAPGLAPGSYAVHAYDGKDVISGAVYARQSVTLEPGVTATVRLELVKPPQSTGRDYSGVLAVPLAWQADFKRLSVEWIDPSKDRIVQKKALDLNPSVEREGVREYAWRLRDAVAGTYIISHYDPNYTWSIALGADTANGVRLELPPPASVSVRCVDADTNADVLVEGVSWHTVRPQPDRGGTSTFVKRDADTGRCATECPIGAIELSPFLTGLGYEHVSKLVTVVAGTNDVEILMRKATCLRFILKDGDKDLPPQKSVEFDVVDTARRGQVGSVRSRSDHGVTLDRPGTYRVTLKTPIAGFRPPFEQYVEAKAGQVTDVVIRLARKP